MARTLRTAIAALAAVLVVPLAGVQPAAADDDLTCPGQSEHNSGIRLTSAAERPVVMVHGWNSSSGSLTDMESALIAPGAETAGRVRPLYFDYRSSATHWASVRETAACLADYVRDASEQYRKLTGGDGRVVVVAHSMGGLAIRFATDSRYAQDPITADQLAGVVTLGTPSLGSPFGGHGPDGQFNRFIGHLNADDRLGLFESREQGTDGGTCLARHSDPDHELPDGCAVAPYLPAPWRLSQVAGDVTVDRTMFGLPLYSIPLAGDGIVPLSSAHGYARSAPGDDPWPAEVETRRVTCSIGFETAWSALAAAIAGVGGGAAGVASRKPEIAWLGLRSAVSLLNDFDTFEALEDEEMALGLAAYLGVSSQLAPCGHSNLTSDPEPLAAMVGSVARTLDALPPRAAVQAENTISVDGFGPVPWGTSRDDAEALLRQPFEIVGEMRTDCIEATLPGVSATTFAFVGGVLSGADVTDDSVESDTGIRVGSPVADVLAAYPDASVGPLPHWDGTPVYTHTSNGRVAEFIVYPDGDDVDVMRFGLAGTLGEATPCDRVHVPGD